MTDGSGSSTAPSEALLVRVCMVDDDPSSRYLVTMLLKLENISVKACPLGWPAHECIRTSQPKVVLLDVEMPDVDGIHLFYLLRADPTTREIPVIFLTGSPTRVASEVPNYQEMGATLLPKPFAPNDLLELVRTVIATT